MREMFLAYKIKGPSDYSELWKHAHFSFDANILLDTYELTNQSRTVLFEQLRRLDKRAFLTHQAALEFYRNRRRVISSARKNVEAIAAALQEIPAAFSEKARAAFAKLLNEESSEITKFLSDDPIETTLDEIFGKRVSKPLQNLEQLYPDFDARFQQQVPPGFADIAKKEDFRKYGDVVLWFELIEYARENRVPIVLVTAETKNDWWQKQNQAIVGPRQELAQEMWDKAGVMFHLYSMSDFLKYAQLELKGAADEQASSAVDEVQRLEDRNESRAEITSERAIALAQEQESAASRSWDAHYRAIQMLDEAERRWPTTTMQERLFRQLEHAREGSRSIRNIQEHVWPESARRTYEELERQSLRSASAIEALEQVERAQRQYKSLHSEAGSGIAALYGSRPTSLRDFYTSDSNVGRFTNRSNKGGSTSETQDLLEQSSGENGDAKKKAKKKNPAKNDKNE